MNIFTCNCTKLSHGQVASVLDCSSYIVDAFMYVCVWLEHWAEPWRPGETDAATPPTTTCPSSHISKLLITTEKVFFPPIHRLHNIELLGQCMSMIIIVMVDTTDSDQR